MAKQVKKHTAEHTPGPWECEQDGYDWRVYSDDWGGIVHRNCYPNPKVDVHTEGDAHLIASAPEMLEALERVVSEIAKLDQEDVHISVGCILDMDRAISKAKGATASRGD